MDYSKFTRKTGLKFAGLIIVIGWLIIAVTLISVMLLVEWFRS